MANPARHHRSRHRSASRMPKAGDVSTFFETLEERQMLSVGPMLCMCPACVAARQAALAAKTPAALQTLASGPAVEPLKAVATLAKSAAKTVSAAYGSVFSATTALTKAANGAKLHLEATSVSPFSLDMTGIKNALATAPAEFTKAAAKSPLVLAIPGPDGTLERYKVVTTTVMDPTLAKQFPSIKTYRGVGIDDPTASIRLDTTSLGFHAQVIAADNKSFLIDPYFLNDATGTYASYYNHDAISSENWTCTVINPTTSKTVERSTLTKGQNASSLADGDDNGGPVINPSITYASTLKTYRAAVAADGEYTTAVGGGTVTGGQSAVVTAMNRVDGVYETELDIRMVLVANNSSLIYTNSSTDPYSNGSSDINVNTSNINSVIGSANYDIGHVFTTGSGGVAQLGCVGGSSKGAGTTGTSNPVGDAFTIDYVAHEMGHQFNANHTFNTSGDSGNRSGSHAYEPGSGSTIMAYAGIEGTEDLQAHSDPFFHSDSIDAIRTFVTSSIPSVGTSSATGNNAPTISAGSNYVIPTNTPFALTASGSDPDGDAITYEWQERDLGAAITLQTADNGTSPLFRDYVPSASPTRSFPQLATILAGSTTTAARSGLPNAAERLPTVARAAMKFRVIARDNKSGGGGVSTADMQVQVVNTGATFAVTGLDSSGTTLTKSTSQTITWNVAGTTANGINVANVKISLSTDGGQTFSTVLAASTANDGSETITLPNIVTSTARIKIEAIGNIFFDINNANFAIAAPVIANGTWTGSGDGINWTDANNWSNNLVPDSATDVTINVPDSNPTIVVSGSQIARSLVTSEAINITGSLALTVSSTFNAAVNIAGSLSNAANSVFNFPVTLTGTISGNGSVVVNSTLAWSSGTLIGGAFIVNTNGVMNISGSGVRDIQRALTVRGTINVAPGGNTLLHLDNFSITSVGLIDLTDNDLATTDFVPTSTVQSYVVTSRNGGQWNTRGGITSSFAKPATPSDPLKPTGLGVLTDVEYASATGGNTLFDGFAYGDAATLVKYTYNGDANFDGKVDANDYARIDAGFQNQTGAGFVSDWFTGNFDYNSTIDANDYALIDAAFQLQSGIL